MAVTSLPIVTIAIGSLGEGWRYPAILPEQITLEPWLQLLKPRSGIVQAALSSVLLAVIVTTVAVAIAIPAGYSLARTQGRTRTLLFAAFIVPAATPAFAIAFGLHAVWLRLGVDGSLLGVAVGQLVPATPYAVLIIASACMHIDPEREDQARTLGARSSTLAVHVILPLIRPSIGVAAAAAFIVAWGEYVIVLLLGGGRVITLPMHTLGFALGGERAVASALLVLYLLPPLCALLAINILGTPARRSSATNLRAVESAFEPPAGRDE